MKVRLAALIWVVVGLAPLAFARGWFDGTAMVTGYFQDPRFLPALVSIPSRLLPPVWYDKGNPEYLLGTDQLGRDQLSRLIYGARVSVIVGVAGVVVSLLMVIVCPPFGADIETSIGSARFTTDLASFPAFASK